MSERIEDQIARMGEVIDRELPPITIDELHDLLEQSVAKPPVRRISGPVVAAAAAIVVVLVGGVALLINNSDGTQPANTVVATTLAEPTPTTAVQETTPTPTTVLQETASGDLEVSWREVDWGLPLYPARVLSLDGSGVLFRLDRGRLLSSGDAETWEPLFADLAGVSIAVDGPLAVVAGTRNDGTSALFTSTDGETWSEVDYSTLPGTGQLEVAGTTRGGLTWFHIGGSGVLAMIADDQLIDIHVPPWSTFSDIELVETTSGIVAFKRSDEAWSYQGSGQWSPSIEIPKTDEHVQVGDTILMIDQTNSTCCANPILGESFWPLLSSNDGINWTEVSILAGSTAYPPVSGGSDGVHNLHLVGGESFWVYGPQIGGGGDGIDYDALTTLWITTDGTNWQPVDVDFDPPTFGSLGSAFVRAAGDFIFVHYPGPVLSQTVRWVGEVKRVASSSSDQSGSSAPPADESSYPDSNALDAIHADLEAAGIEQVIDDKILVEMMDWMCDGFHMVGEGFLLGGAFEFVREGNDDRLGENTKEVFKLVYAGAVTHHCPGEGPRPTPEHLAAGTEPVIDDEILVETVEYMCDGFRLVGEHFLEGGVAHSDNSDNTQFNDEAKDLGFVLGLGNTEYSDSAKEMFKAAFSTALNDQCQGVPHVPEHLEK